MVLPAATDVAAHSPPGPLECLDQGARSFDFGDRQVGTTSPAQGFALGVFNVDTLTPRISVSGDYAQTNSCPPTLSVTGVGQVQGCVINVTFTPTGTGPQNGTLSAGPGGPTLALTGTGVTTPTPESVPPEPWAANLPYTACTLSAEGRFMGDKLKPAEGALLGPAVWCVPDPTICHWQSGGTYYLNLKLTKKMRKQARKALDDGKKVRAKVTVRAKDAAGNVATAKRTSRLVK